MLKFSVPGVEEPYVLKRVILDLNGTIAFDGRLLPGVKEGIDALRGQLEFILFSGDTNGTAAGIAEALGISWRYAPSAEAKAAEARILEPEHCATIGNGRIDLELFRTVRLRIGVILGEGASPHTLSEADVVVTSIADAFGLLANPKRLIATMRK